MIKVNKIQKIKMMNAKIENKTIVIFQLLLAIAIVVTISTIGPPALHDLNESLNQQVQQTCNIGILNIQPSQNMNITQEKEILNQIYCEELSLINNLTTNNG